MTKWFAYIVMLLIFAPCVSLAVTKYNGHDLIPGRGSAVIYTLKPDTIIVKKKSAEDDDKNKIKEVSKSKRQAKPEKLDDDTKPAHKREQRPAGMERPPEIPRRNNN